MLVLCTNKFVLNLFFIYFYIYFLPTRVAANSTKRISAYGWYSISMYIGKQGARKDGQGNEPVGSCAMCDTRSTGPRALKGKNR